MDFQLFSRLSSLPAACGREELLRDEIIKISKPFADEITVDNVGNIIILKKGAGGKKIMLAAHMDEVSLRVKYIDDCGFLRFVQTGIDAGTLLAQRVLVQTENHGIIPGVIGAKHAQPLSVDSLYIDIGYTKEHAAEIITIGDPVTLDRSPIEFGDGLICAKAIDDRAGVYILLETLKTLPKNHSGDIYFVFTVQEERDSLGAQAAAFAINPDVALIVDATGALDVPGTPAQDIVVKTGGGVAITLADAMTISHNGVVKHLKEICAEGNIAYQLRVSAGGGNDAVVIKRNGAGVPVGIISLPTRYMHTNVEVASKRDIDAATALVKRFALEAGDRKY